MLWWLLALGAWAEPLTGSEMLQTAIDKLEAGEEQASRELFVSALPELQRAVEAEPQSAEAHFQLGQAQYFTGADGLAEASWRRALELQADHEGAMHYLALLSSDRGEWVAAAEAWRQVAERHPANPAARWNQGQALQLAGEAAAARAVFSAIAEQQPQEWRALSKLIQLAQAQGDLAGRDEAYARLRALRESGTVPELSQAKLFVRDQFEAHGKAVMVLEYFELEGDMPRIYVFALQDPSSGTEIGQISLGSYEETTRFSREMGTVGPDERMFHLDGYWPDGAHSTFGFFQKRPSYDEIREVVLQILEGSVQVMSSITPTSDGGVEVMLPVPDKTKKRKDKRKDNRKKERAPAE